jgi:hypothetical protein
MGVGGGALRTRVQVLSLYRTISPLSVVQPATRFMKRQFEKPVDEPMKFFTRGLYVQFNSTDPRKANEAEATWEHAIVNYKRHLRELNDRLPDAAKKLAKVSLHDAELVDPKDPFVFRMDEAAAIGVVKKTNPDVWQAYFICYQLCGQVDSSEPTTGRPFSRRRVHWLYDEFDVTARNRCVHRILFSDGRVVSVPFRNLTVQRITMQPESTSAMSVNSA